MPCTYYLPGEEAALARDEANKVRKELDKVTRLLCDLTARIPKKYIEAGTELETWVAEHAEMDKRRKAAEEKKIKQEIERKKEELEATLKKAERLSKELASAPRKIKK